jgi:hypothetical protein
MPSIQQQMQDVISRLVPEIIAHAQRHGETDVRPVPSPPATRTEIAAYEKYLELELPPSYRAFLELHNGYIWLAYPGGVLSTHDVMPGGDWYDRIQKWKKMSARYGMGEVLDAIVFANLDSSLNWGYMDPNRPTAKGELTTCRWLNGDRDDYPDLVEFFESRIRFCRIDLKPSRKAKAPRSSKR